MKGSELTLVFFTLFMQTAVGLILTIGLVNNLTGWKNSIPNSRGINDKLLFLVCGLFLIALIISFLHLGNIKNAIYTLSNLTGSWLSREILAVTIFGTMIFLFSLFHVRNITTSLVQNVMLILAILSGIALVFVMAKIYMLEIVPAWNSMFTPVSFYLSSFILGGFAFLAGVLYFLRGSNTEFIPVAKIITGILALLVLCEALLWIYQIMLLSNGERAAVESYNIIVNGNTVLFISRIILQAVGLAFLVYSFMLLNRGILNGKYIFISYVIILFAEIAGRYLFYAMYARTGV